MSQASNNNGRPTPSGPNRGQFPFPLSSTNEESKYLTWLRNHSNYLAVGGLLNSLGAIAIYVRGVFGNLLILMPILIIAGALLGWWHAELYNNPFAFTKWFLLYGLFALILYFGYESGSRYAKHTVQSKNLIAYDLIALNLALLSGFLYLLINFSVSGSSWEAVWIFAAIISMYAGYTRHRNGTISEENSVVNNVERGLFGRGLVNVKQRLARYSTKFFRRWLDNFKRRLASVARDSIWLIRGFREHFAAWILIAIGFCVLVESSPHVIELFRKHFIAGGFGLKECLTTIIAVVASLGGLLKFLPRLSEVWKTLLIVVAAIVSFVLVWGVVLRIANFLFYGLPISDWRTWTPFACLAIIYISFLVSIFRATGIPKRRRLLQFAWVTLAVVATFPITIFVVAAIKYDANHAQESLGTLSRPLARLVDGLKSVNTSQKASDRDALLVDLVARKTSLDGEASIPMLDEPRYKMTGAPQLSPEFMVDDPLKVFRRQYLIKESFWETIEDTFTAPSSQNEHVSYFYRASLFLERAEDLADAEKLQKGESFRALSRSAIDRLHSLAEQLEVASFDLEDAVMQRVLDQTVPEMLWFQRLEVNEKDGKQIAEWLGSSDEIFLNQLKVELAKIFLPVSLAEEYLRLIPDRLKELDSYRGTSAPDAAASGPPLFSRKRLELKTLRIAVECAKLRFLLSGLLPSEADRVIESLPNEWFAVRKTDRSDFDSFARLDINEKSASVDQIIQYAVEFDDDIDARGMLRRCGIQPPEYQVVRNGDMEPIVFHEGVVKFDDTNEFKRSKRVVAVCRRQLIELALQKISDESDITEAIPEPDNKLQFETAEGKAKFIVAELFDPWVPIEASLDEPTKKRAEDLVKKIYARRAGKGFSKSDLSEMIAARFIFTSKNDGKSAAQVIRRVVHGRYGNLSGVEFVSVERFKKAWLGKFLLLLTLFVSIWIFGRYFINPNATSVHGFYRDKLSTAFILTQNPNGEVEPERNVKLSQLSNYDPDKGVSTAPYHIINTAINLQGSSELNIRDRNADFFFFSKLFVGGETTGYVSTVQLEEVAPEFTAGSAMAISAAAAAPTWGNTLCHYWPSF